MSSWQGWDVAKGKRAKRSRTAAGTGAVAPSPVEADPTRPSGQRCYDMPYSSPSPRVINPELGLHNLVARAGHNAAYSIDVTLLDAPDHRLIRSGVLLAHRVLDGRGEWFLSAPDWQPLLPKDRIELMGHDELPDEFADLVRPLRRRATLGPVAALRCERREFALRDDQGGTLALLRDDKVTVRRGGLTTARYRQVLITPVGPGLSEPQVAWVDRAFTQAGANRVPRFPRLVSRLGAPATGPTDFPDPRPFDPAAPFKRFVSQILALRLRRIIEADLAFRGGDLTATGRVAAEAVALRSELKGLSVVLDPDWVEDLYDELDWIVVQAGAGAPDAPAPPDPTEHLVRRLRSERYLTLVERLVGAVRSPQLAEAPTISQPGGRPTAEVLADLRGSAVQRFRRSADGLRVDAPERDWSEALRSLGQLQWVVDLTGQLLTQQTEPLARALRKPHRLLVAVQDDQAHADQTKASLDELSPADAFEAGRVFERQVAARRHLREQFLADWPKRRARLDP